MYGPGQLPPSAIPWHAPDEIGLLLVGAFVGVGVGLVGGVVVRGVVVALGLSDAPARGLAARLLGLPTDEVSSANGLGAHLLVAAGFISMYGVVWGLVFAVATGDPVARPVPLHAWSVVLGLGVVGLAWASLTGTWLPAVESRLDDVRAVRRQWVGLHLLLGAFAGLVYPSVIRVLLVAVYHL